MFNTDFKIDRILNGLGNKHLGMSVIEFLDCLNWDG